MSRRTPRRVGRRTCCTPDVHKQIVEAIAGGIPVTHAAINAGIPSTTFYTWLGRGQDVAEARDDPQHPQTPEPHELPYLELWESVGRARAQAASKAVQHIAKAAEGGYVVRETTRRYRDADGQMVTETDRVFAPVDWRAAAWFLERADRVHWTKTSEVQLTGRDGGPIEVGVADYESLAARLRANLSRVAGELPMGAADNTRVIDGEVDRAS